MATKYSNLGLDQTFEQSVVQPPTEIERIKATILVHKQGFSDEIRDELVEMLGLITQKEHQKGLK